MGPLGDWYVVVFIRDGKPEMVGSFTDEAPTCNLKYQLQIVGSELVYETAKILERLVSIDLGVSTYSPK